MGTRITQLQMFLMLFIAQTGTVFISFQSPLIQIAGTESWFVFFCLGLLFLPHIWLFERFFQYFVWSKPICIMYAGYWFFICVSFTGKNVYTLNVWAFPETPVLLVIVLMGSVMLAVVLSKPSTAVNLGVILIPLIVIFILFVSMAANDLIWTNLLPVGQLSLGEFRKAVQPAQLPFVGIELYLLFRLMQPEKVGFRRLFLYFAIWFAFFLYMLIFPLAYFSLKEFELFPDPIIYLLRSQEVTFVERLDLFFIYIWLAWSIVTISLYAFAVIRLLGLMGILYYKKIAVWMTVLFIIATYFVVNKNAIQFNTKVIPYIHGIFGVALPAAVIVFNKIKGRTNAGRGISS
ncbi:GerAB/ArcD/ProY family transporter [Bhargavaea beijingensis]|uniref:Spore germination protein (Amino acid permease) n=1 Tax=Bhargavaea beijingensis TaxID=426756 RepID=A0ABX9ZC43_9BACL|nr:GerAB/ArcD/ProY family transporter [Bhargavaea beijingensis]RSK30945.1 hypothetical protein EJA12_09505 [Bhargavaea beijingensis]